MSRPEFTSQVRVQYVPEQSQPPDGPFAFAYAVTSPLLRMVTV